LLAIGMNSFEAEISRGRAQLKPVVRICQWFQFTRNLSGRSFRNQSSNDMAFPHPKSRKDNHWNRDKPNNWSVVWKLFERTVNITDYGNGKDDMNPAKDGTFGGFFHD
jgi:hypothetical protein